MMEMKKCNKCGATETEYNRIDDEGICQNCRTLESMLYWSR